MTNGELITLTVTNDTPITMNPDLLPWYYGIPVILFYAALLILTVWGIGYMFLALSSLGKSTSRIEGQANDIIGQLNRVLRNQENRDITTGKAKE